MKLVSFILLCGVIEELQLFKTPNPKAHIPSFRLVSQ